jgi:hypothetical protein
MLGQEYSHESGRHSPPERMPLSDRSFTGTVSISRFLPESESVLGVAATGVGGRGDLFVFPGLSGGAVRRWKGPWPALRPARLGCATRFPVENGAACRWLGAQLLFQFLHLLVKPVDLLSQTLVFFLHSTTAGPQTRLPGGVTFSEKLSSPEHMADV